MKFFNSKEIETCTIDSRSKIKDVINSLSKSSMQICLVTTNTNYLVGVLTDGDIRRGLLQGMDINSNINSLIKKSPSVINENSPSYLAKYLMETKSLFHIPVVNEDFELRGLYTIDYFSSQKKKNNPVLIMAGGFGKRLHPYTKNCPKPMLEINGRPILEHIIVNLSNKGFNNFYISVHYLKDNIKAYFKDGKMFKVKIKYIEENEPLGTIGALGKMKYRNKEPIIVVNGDTLTNLDFEQFLDFHKKNKSFATIAVKEIKSTNPYGVIDVKGIKLNRFKEKPVKKMYINTGIYIFSKSSINLVGKNNPIDAPSFLMNLKKKDKNVSIFPIHENWEDIGDKKKYLEIKKKLKP